VSRSLISRRFQPQKFESMPGYTVKKRAADQHVEIIGSGTTTSGAHEQLRIGSGNWLPLVDALRTRLLVPAPDMVETLDLLRSSASLRAGSARVS